MGKARKAQTANEKATAATTAPESNNERKLDPDAQAVADMAREIFGLKSIKSYDALLSYATLASKDRYDHDGRPFGLHVPRLQKKFQAGERVVKADKLHGSIHEAIRLGVDPKNGGTAQKALETLNANYANLPKVIQTWLDERPVLSRNESGNYQQGYHFGVRYRWETPAGSNAGSSKRNTDVTSKGVSELEGRVAQLEDLLRAALAKTDNA